MTSQKFKWIALLFVVLPQLQGCSSDTGQERDPTTGQLVARSCHGLNGLSPQLSVTAEYNPEKTYLNNIQPFKNLNIAEAKENKLIEVYDRQTCDSRIWVDRWTYDGIQMSISTNSDWFSLIVAKGFNEIEYSIKTCRDIGYVNGVYNCETELAHETGTFGLMVP